MKLTKVKGLRIAVSRYTKKTGRGILYPVPNWKSLSVTDEKIKERVNDANRLYSVFFRNDVPVDLEKHFQNICEIAQNSEESTLEEDLQEYTNGASFQFTVAGKKELKKVLQLHVKQRMTALWQEEAHCDSAVAILECICCGKTYIESIKKLFLENRERGILFMDVCKKQGNETPYVDSSDKLEEAFSLVVKAVAEQCDIDAYYKKDTVAIEKNLEKQLDFLENLSEVKKVVKNKNGEQVYITKLNEFSYAYVEEDRFNAILVRMRKSLKRDRQRQTAILLLQALAQKDNKTLQSFIREAKDNNNQVLLDDIKKFLYVVNKDYYHINIVLSIKNMNLRVQANQAQLDLSSATHKKKKVLNETLERYASSQEASNRVLLDLKTLLFDYFSIIDKEKKFLTVEKLWAFPTRDMRYFDSDFIPFGSSEEWNKNRNQTLLEAFWSENQRTNKKKDRAIKKRINYINYGKYLSLIKNETDPFRKYWCAVIKEYIEKEFVKRKEMLQENDCFNATIMVNCWKYLIRLLCGKYIDIGKMVYHFVVPEDMTIKKDIAYDIMKPEYQNGISSFALEVIKAEETRQRAIAHATATAVSNFSRAVLDYNNEEFVNQDPNEHLTKDNKLEDITTMKEKVFLGLLRQDTGKQILRFYGGMSTFSHKDIFITGQGTAEEVENQVETQKLALELCQHFKKLRNANFHYTDGKNVEILGHYTKLLMENDEQAYEKIVQTRYYSNNTAMFYKEEDIKKLVKQLYTQTKFREAQIPAFRTVWKQKDIVEDLNVWKEMQLLKDWKLDKTKTTQFSSSFYYLLKEIYYHDFILRQDMKQRFFDAVNNYVKKYESREFYNREYVNAGKNLQTYLKKLEKNASFGQVCQAIMQEYNQQNAKEEDKEIYKHFKLLLPICIKNAFQQYINESEKYVFLRKPSYYKREGEPNYLNDVKIKYHFGKDKRTTTTLYEWYTLAHFISPRQLNYFIGEWKNYIQYRNDIFKRSQYAGELKKGSFDNPTIAYQNELDNMRKKVAEAEEIVKVLEFVLQVAGRVSNQFYDYYKDKEDYAKYMYQYIDFPLVSEKAFYFDSLKQFCQNTLSNGEMIDIYADAENPKILRNIEMTRMYAGGDVHLEGHRKVSVNEIKEYYEKQKEVTTIQANGLCETEIEQKKIKRQQELRNRITLNDVTDYYELTNDLLGQLISLSYLRERDYMYLFLGFYYMALRSQDGWNGEIGNAIQNEKVSIRSGFVLYQVISMFDFGIPFFYEDKEKDKKWTKQTGEIGRKITRFCKSHPNSWSCVIRLLEDEKYYEEIINLRNYVDHAKYYTNHDKSLMELYNEFYAKFFGYSEKLKQNVLNSFQSILEDYFVTYKVKFVNKQFCIDENLESATFTYKLKKKENEKVQKTVNVPARSQEYLREVQQVLEYKK